MHNRDNMYSRKKMQFVGVQRSACVSFADRLVSPGTSCPNRWYYYERNCYYPSNWEEGGEHSEARDKCLTIGADLVSISDQDEMDFVISIS